MYPDPPLLPKDPVSRAYVRSIASAVACEIHPLNNLRALKYITGPLGHGEADKVAWIHHWIGEGFAGIEAAIAASGRAGDFVCGNRPGLADAFLVPQVFNAMRFDCNLDAYPTIMRINANCLELPQFRAAHPDAQGDAPR